MLEIVRPFIISFLIGLAIGIERERSHPAGMQSMGVRTFILIALLGTVAAEVRQLYIAISIAFFVFAIILAGYFRTSRDQKHIGITTEVAAGSVFCLGFLSYSNMLLSVILGLAILIILLGREGLHVFAREKIKSKEIRATVAILIIALTVLSFLPNRTVDPWGLFNPQKFGIIVMLLAAMQFGGYIAVRLFGHRLGAILLGFFGGFASSTAVYATLPKYSRTHPKKVYPLVTAAVFAQVGTLIELLIVLYVIAPKLVENIVWPIVGISAVGLSSALLVMNSRASRDDAIKLANNPLDFRSLIRLSLFIGGMLAIIAIARRFLAPEGVRLVTFLGGLFEMHSVSIATATLYTSKKLALDAAKLNVSIAIVASFVSKFILLWSLARNRFALITSGFLLLMLVVGAGIYVGLMML